MNKKILKLNGRKGIEVNGVIHYPFKDEVVVEVLSALGQMVGSFVWPKKHYNMLEELNKSYNGNEFRIVK